MSIQKPQNESTKSSLKPSTHLMNSYHLPQQPSPPSTFSPSTSSHPSPPHLTFPFSTILTLHLTFPSLEASVLDEDAFREAGREAQDSFATQHLKELLAKTKTAQAP